MGIKIKISNWLCAKIFSKTSLTSLFWVLNLEVILLKLAF